MQTSQEKPQKRNPILLVIGILILMLACLFFSGAVLLDAVGAKATGKLSNAAKNCSAGKTCWTGRSEVNYYLKGIKLHAHLQEKRR